MAKLSTASTSELNAEVDNDATTVYESGRDEKEDPVIWPMDVEMNDADFDKLKVWAGKLGVSTLAKGSKTEDLNEKGLRHRLLQTKYMLKGKAELLEEQKKKRKAARDKSRLKRKKEAMLRSSALSKSDTDVDDGTEKRRSSKKSKTSKKGVSGSKEKEPKDPTQNLRSMTGFSGFLPFGTQYASGGFMPGPMAAPPMSRTGYHVSSPLPTQYASLLSQGNYNSPYNAATLAAAGNGLNGGASLMSPSPVSPSATPTRSPVRPSPMANITPPTPVSKFTSIYCVGPPRMNDLDLSSVCGGKQKGQYVCVDYEKLAKYAVANFPVKSTLPKAMGLKDSTELASKVATMEITSFGFASFLLHTMWTVYFQCPATREPQWRKLVEFEKVVRMFSADCAQFGVKQTTQLLRHIPTLCTCQLGFEVAYSMAQKDIGRYLKALTYESRRSTTAGGKRQRNQICNDWNRNGTCKWKESCRFKHVCLRCGGGHRSVNCKETKKTL